MPSFPLVVNRLVPTELTRHLDDLDLTVRSRNCLHRHDLTLVADLALVRIRALMKPLNASVKANFGKKSLEECADELGKLIGEKVDVTGVSLLDLPGRDALTSRLYGLPHEVKMRISRQISVRGWAIADPTLLALVLAPLELSEAEHALVNAELAPFGLRLNMTLSDIWVQQ